MDFKAAASFIDANAARNCTIFLDGQRRLSLLVTVRSDQRNN